MVSMLHLESQPEEQRGKTLASYRKEKQDKRNTDPSLKLSYGRGGRGRGNDAVSGRNSMDADRSPLDTQRNFKQRREGQRIDAMLNQEPMDFEWPKQGRGRAKNDLIPNTILEEDSAEDGF